METYKLIEISGSKYFVNPIGSMAIVRGYLYRNGKKVEEGLYTINLENDFKLIITVGVGGQVLEQQTIEKQEENNA